jgi:hypothetical protein
MGGSARGHFDGLKIELAGYAEAGENNIQQGSYFARDFLADRFEVFS